MSYYNFVDKLFSDFHLYHFLNIFNASIPQTVSFENNVLSFRHQNTTFNCNVNIDNPSICIFNYTIGDLLIHGEGEYMLNILPKKTKLHVTNGNKSVQYNFWAGKLYSVILSDTIEIFINCGPIYTISENILYVWKDSYKRGFEYYLELDIQKADVDKYEITNQINIRSTNFKAIVQNNLLVVSYYNVCGEYLSKFIAIS